MKRNKCKNIILLCIVCLVTVLCIPTKQVSASEVLLNTPEELVWGQSYSGELENKYQVYQYTFTLSQSGHIGMVFNAKGDSLKLQIFDSAQNRICIVDPSEGMTNQSFELLRGEYIMKISTAYYDCKFSFTPTFTASGETQSESYDEKNNEMGLATSYLVGEYYTGQLADNDFTDIYKMEVTGNGNLTLNVNSKFQEYYIKLVNDYGDISYEEAAKAGKF